MSLLTRLRYRWRTLFDSHALDSELDAELADHLRRQTEANIARGMSPAEARRHAQLDFGGVQRFKEETRDTRGLRWFEDLRNDARFAIRLLVKNPLFTGTVVITLALGIGLSTAVFATIDALLLRPLPGVQAPDELVQVFRTAPGDERFNASSIPHYVDVRARSTDVFSGTAAWSFTTMGISVANRPAKLFGAMVSGNYFTVLGAAPALGRLFGAAEDVGRGGHPIAVLSDATWKTYFGGDPNVIGRTLLVNGQQVQVVGVTRPEFGGVMPIVRPALYMPLMQLTQLRPGSDRDFDNRGNNYMNIVARLRAGTSVAQAESRMTSLSAELRAMDPAEYEDRGINIVPQSKTGIHPALRTAQIGLSTVVMIVVALLLLVACVNVANLFLARAGERAREMAIRLSLGARRGLLFRQLMVESLFFALVSGIAGLLIAYAVISLANNIRLPMDFDLRPDLRVSPSVLAFALVTTVLTAVLFGIAPALQATHPSLIPALKGDLPSGATRSRTSRVLVVSQVALSIVLLISAGLFAMNLRSASTIDHGFKSDHLLTAQVNPALAGYSSARAEGFYRQLTERLTASPGVTSVAFVEELPLGLNGSDGGITVPGYVPAKNESMSIQYSMASPGYFTTMRTPMLRGREFLQRDDSAAARVIVVNQRFAERFWPGQEALGKTVQSGTRMYTVIGVVPTGKYKSLGETPTAYMWYSAAQANAFGMTAVIRVAGDPDTFISTLRSAVAALDPNMPLSNLRSMEQHLGITLMPARLIGGALAVFGVLGLLLASVGMYGVVAYSVSQRTREIGIRMAIGANGRQVVVMIMRQGLTLVLIGTAIGIAGAMMASRLLDGLLYGGSAVDPVAFGLVPLVLVAVAAAATFVPARRAAAVDPAIALRAE